MQTTPCLFYLKTLSKYQKLMTISVESGKKSLLMICRIIQENFKVNFITFRKTMKPIKDKFFFLKTKNIHFNFNCKPNKNKFTFSMKKSILYSKIMRPLLLLSNLSILNFRHLSVSFMKRTCLLRLKLRLSPRIIKSSSFNQKKSTVSILNLRRNILAKCK